MANTSDNIFNRLKEGHWLYGGAADCPEVSEALQRCADACFELNNIRPSESEKRNKILLSILGSAIGNFVIHSPFRCDFGFNIHLGRNFIGNFNLSILDEAEVKIGDNVMIGPNCSLLTIIHAMLPGQRSLDVMQAKPIIIGNNVWIAANVTILPGITIGDDAAIGAGSVVTKSIPPRTFAAGNPCKPIREITENDRVSLLLKQDNSQETI